MDSALLVIAAVIGGFGIVVMLAAVFIIGLTWGRVLRSLREHDEMEKRLREVTARSRRSLPNQGSSGSR